MKTEKSFLDSLYEQRGYVQQQRDLNTRNLNYFDKQIAGELDKKIIEILGEHDYGLSPESIMEHIPEVQDDQHSVSYINFHVRLGALLFSDKIEEASDGEGPIKYRLKGEQSK